MKKHLLFLFASTLICINAFAQAQAQVPDWIQSSDNTGFTYGCDSVKTTNVAWTTWLPNCDWNGTNGTITSDATLSNELKFTWGHGKGQVFMFLQPTIPLNLTANPKVQFTIKASGDTTYRVFLQTSSGTDVSAPIYINVTTAYQTFVADFTGKTISGKNYTSITSITFAYTDCNSAFPTATNSIYLKAVSGGGTIITSIVNASEIGLSLYPNPSNDGTFQVKADNISVDRIVVSNVNGVSEEFHSEKFTTTLKGLLSVQIYTSKGLVSEKVIVQ